MPPHQSNYFPATIASRIDHENDWVGAYVSSTSGFGVDGKIHAQGAQPPPTPAVAESMPGSDACRSAKAPDYNLEVTTGARDSRRRSWAAPNAAAAGSIRRPGGGAAAAAAAAMAAAAAAAVVAGTSTRSTSAASPPSAPTAASAASATTAPKVSSPPGALNAHAHGGGGNPLGRSIWAAEDGAERSGSGAQAKTEDDERAQQLVAEAEFQAHTSAARKSLSGSGRRASLDYSDLEAVKERVQQAASLWALAEDRDREEAVAAALAHQQMAQQQQPPQPSPQSQQQPSKFFSVLPDFPNPGSLSSRHSSSSSSSISPAATAATATTAASVAASVGPTRREKSSVRIGGSGSSSSGGGTAKLSLFRKWLSFGR